MSKPVTPVDLEDQIGKNPPHKILLCRVCGAECSAHAGDYWDRPKDYVFKCCRENMVLVYKRVVYEDV